MIPDAAVEAAALVMQANDEREGFGNYPLWEYAEDVKAILEAAAPHMRREAEAQKQKAIDDSWADGYKAGKSDASRPTP